MAVFWVFAPCSLIEVYDVSQMLAASIIRAMRTRMMEAANTSETSFNVFQEDSHLKMNCCII
jgi:hypothetical protein